MDSRQRRYPFQRFFGKHQSLDWSLRLSVQIRPHLEGVLPKPQSERGSATRSGFKNAPTQVGLARPTRPPEALRVTDPRSGIPATRRRDLTRLAPSTDVSRNRIWQRRSRGDGARRS